MKIVLAKLVNLKETRSYCGEKRLVDYRKCREDLLKNKEISYWLQPHETDSSLVLGINITKYLRKERNVNCLGN